MWGLLTLLSAFLDVQSISQGVPIQDLTFLQIATRPAISYIGKLQTARSHSCYLKSSSIVGGDYMTKAWVAS